MAKKIGILTLNGYNNYGNRLQNYALEEVIRSLGFEVETIIVDRGSDEKLVSRLRKMSSFREAFDKISNRIKLYSNREIIDSRKKTFMDFSKKYINETEFVLSKNSIPADLSDKYQYFIVGSDQVWNPNNLHGTSFFFLTFAEKKKRIAYAPSFGISEIGEKDIPNYKNWITDMHKLSVREDAGTKIIKELTGRDATVLVDPTLLISREKWLRVSKKAPNKPDKNYLLTYFLGGIPDKYEKEIKRIAKMNKLNIVNLGNIREKKAYSAGPSEFIDYIEGCSMFCTDSFHGTVFSIILNKPFIVYERVGTMAMFSRINTLLEKFNLESRKAENINFDKDIFNIDFSNIPLILDTERQKSLNFLKDALGIDKDAK